MNSVIGTSSARVSEWKIVKGGLVAGAAIFGGQLLGFVRHAVIAYLLGTGPPADALVVAVAPVDLWWAVLATTVIFGFGPLLAAPGRGPAFSDFARPIVGLSATAALLLLIGAGLVVRLLAPGLPEETAAHAERLLRITATAIPPVSLSTLFTAFLYSRRRFAFAAFHQGTVNIAIISAAFLLHSRLGAAGFAVGYSAGAWLQLGAAWWISRRLIAGGAAARGRLSVRELVHGPGPVLAYSLLVGLNPVVTRALASTFGPGSTAAFDYCLKLTGVPLALLVNSLSSSLMSELAPFRFRADREVAIGAVGRAAALTALVSLAAVLIVLGLAPVLVALLFERGRFSAASTQMVAAVLSGFYPVLVAWSVLDVISRSLFSMGKWRMPILCAAVALLTNATLSFTGVVAQVRWIGLPAVTGFTAAAVISAFYLYRLRSAGRSTA